MHVEIKVYFLFLFLLACFTIGLETVKLGYRSEGFHLLRRFIIVLKIFSYEDIIFDHVVEHENLTD